MRRAAVLTLSAILVLASCAAERFQEERSFEALGFPTRTYTCLSKDRELLTELTVPFNITGRPVRAAFGIRASSQFAPTLQLWFNGALVPGPWSRGPDRYLVRTGFAEEWELDPYVDDLRQGGNEIRLRVEQRLGYCEDFTLLGNSFVRVVYEREASPTPGPTAAKTSATPAPPPAVTGEAPRPLAASPSPSGAASTPTPAPRLDVGATCASGAECISGTCNVVCCLSGQRCCSRDAHCRPDELCDAARAYCVPRPAATGAAAPSDRGDAGALSDLIVTREVIETGLFFAALIVGVYYFSMQERSGRS